MHNTGDDLAGEIMQERRLEIKDIQPDMFHLTERRTDLLCDCLDVIVGNPHEYARPKKPLR